ncbi:ANK2, partial [Symbiodinium pilosum]
ETTMDRNEDAWLVHGGDVWFASSRERPDEWKNGWLAGQVLCVAVDIDAKVMKIAINGHHETRAYRFDPKGQAVYPIVVAETSYRFLLRKRDLRFAEQFPDYEPWLPADHILNPDQKRVVRFTDIPVDAAGSSDLELKLSTSVDSTTFHASTMLATAFRVGCSWDIIEILQRQGCHPSLSSLLAALRYVNAGTKGLMLHNGLSKHPQFSKLLLRPGQEELQPWVFGSFLRYLQNNELTNEDVAAVCQRFADCGAPIHAMYGDYIHARDVSVRAKGVVHRLDGCYVRQDNYDTGRQLFRNLCHTDQWMLYDPDENLWKVGLTQKSVEGSLPGEWHAETPNLEDGKLRVVVDGKDVEDQKDPDATPDRDLSHSKSQRFAKTRKTDDSAFRHFKQKYLSDCFGDLADLLNVSEPHRKVFQQELTKQGHPAADVAAVTLHAAIESAVKEVGKADAEETGDQLRQLRDAHGMSGDLADLSLAMVPM